MKTQCEQVLDWMQRVGPITPAEAIEELGIYRLGARIFDLKRAGWEICAETVCRPNRFGKDIHFARYSLVVHEGQQEFSL
jgi:hypothetical protein